MLKSGDDPRYQYIMTDRWTVQGISKGIPKGASVGYYDYVTLGEVIAVDQYNAIREAKAKWGRHYKDFFVERIEARYER